MQMPHGIIGHIRLDTHESMLAKRDARIAELERLLREAHYFASEDFGPDPDTAAASPRYKAYFKALSSALGKTDRNNEVTK